MKKCEYCAKEITYFEQYCCDDCQESVNKFNETRDRFSKLFSVVSFICVFGIPLGLMVFSFARALGLLLSAGSCFAMGIVLFLLPFPAENMITKYKLKKAIKITRIIGVAVIGVGLAICLLSILLFGI